MSNLLRKLFLIEFCQFRKSYETLEWIILTCKLTAKFQAKTVMKTPKLSNFVFKMGGVKKQHFR